jgi:hypothetical protein
MYRLEAWLQKEFPALDDCKFMAETTTYFPTA